MNVRIIAVTVTLVVLWGASATAGASDGTASAAQSPSVVATAEKPVATMPELKYEFDPVVDGAQVIHDFPIKNTGSGPLAITNVKTG
jgi:hypothetical protein